MIEITCQRSGLTFNAPSKRSKQHPQISAWLQQANKEGWYSQCVEAMSDDKPLRVYASGKESGLTAIEDFTPLIQQARKVGLEVLLSKIAQDKAQEDQFKLEMKRRIYINSRRQAIRPRKWGF